MSETAKHRVLIERYCVGNGLDLGSGGDPVVPHAIQVDLPLETAERYTATNYGATIHLRGDARELRWFRDGVLDWVFSSHLIEDFTQAEQPTILREWGRVVRPGGYLIIMYPESKLWATAVDSGQPCNHNHKYEPFGGEIAGVLRRMGWEIVMDQLGSETDYGWIVVARR